MKKSFNLPLGGLLVVLALLSFTSSLKVEDFTNKIIGRFNKLWMVIPQEKVYLQTDKPYYNAGEDIWFKGYLINATTHEPSGLSRFLYVELIDKTNSVVSRVKIRRDTLGFSGFMKLNPKLASGYFTLRAFTYWMQNASAESFFTKNIFIGNSLVDEVPKKIDNSIPVSDFDVQFFPESGVLVDDNMQAVAFKAIGTDGLSIEVTGKIFNGSNVFVAEFSSINKGMGKFMLEPKKGESYYAVVNTSDGKEKRFNLPLVQTDGIALHLVNYNGKIVYEVINHSNRPGSSLFMVVHSRGKVCAIYPVKLLGGKIPETILPAGINSFAIIDTLGNTLCERLLFNWAHKMPEIKMQSDKNTYGKRQAVNLDFYVSPERGKPADGNFSVSVTDNKTVLKDSLADNIISYFLLSSDIKGHIEEPEAYFTINSAISHEKMDVLLLTQGWRRFNTADIVKGKISKPTYYLERGQALSGKVTNILGKPSKKCDVIALSGYHNIIRTTQTDSLGRYLIEGIEFPDSTSFILKANKKKSLVDVEIIPDTDSFLKSAKIFMPQRTVRIPAPLEYFQQSRDKYYFEGGMKGVNLDEITVVAEKVKSISENQYYSGLADTQVTSKDLEKFSGMSIMTAISMLPGVQVSGEQISIRGSTGNPHFLIDGFSTDRIEEISYLTTNDVAEISLFKGASAAIFGSRGGNGVIAITLKKGSELTSRNFTPPSLSHFVPLGYQKPAQFYVPKYEVDSLRQSSVPDLRTTIYWNPGLSCDSTGIVHVRFFTADKTNNYSVIFEGMTNSGEICRFEGILKRE
ncbi:MAG: TonB-dependent receptor plug domain-containing protein [Prolixibacteraceae bacterium]